jgi:hypothetical protein
MIGATFVIGERLRRDGRATRPFEKLWRTELSTSCGAKNRL